MFKISKQILIMSYEEGETFNRYKNSEYINHKTIRLLKLFNKNNETIFNFIHSDLHKGNWKVRIDQKSVVRLIIYDFGFCWKLPDFICNDLKYINQTFTNILLTGDSEENINDFIKVVNIFSEDQFEVSLLKEEVRILISNGLKLTDPIFLLTLILKIMRKTGKVIHSFVLQILILHTQMDKMYNEIFDGNFIKDNKTYNLEYSYFRYFGDLINFSETYNIFTEYNKYIKQELESEKELKGIKMKKLFVYDRDFDTNEILKKACVQED